MIKKNFKFFVGLIVGLIVSGIGAYAITQIAATTITYDNTNSGLSATDAQAALDELNDKLNNSSRKIVIYSAANDVLYYYDSNNNKVDFCTTNTDGRGICPSPKNGNVTIYSSIAKDPDNIANPYSKQVTIANNTSEFYLMPNGKVLYWYGWFANNWQAKPFAEYHNNDSPNTPTVTKNVNSLTVSASSSGYARGAYISDDPVDPRGYSKLKAYVNSCSGYSDNIGMAVAFADAYANGYHYTDGTEPWSYYGGYSIGINRKSVLPAVLEHSFDFSTYSGGNVYPVIGTLSNGNITATISAIWME